MGQKLYLDTNVYLDYFLDRKDNLRPLGLYASRLYNEAVSCKFQVLISEAVIEEICDVLKFKPRQVWEVMLKPLVEKEKIERVEFSEEEARRLTWQFSRECSLPEMDALHLGISVKTDSILVTRDSHFEKLKERFNIKKPEELLLTV